MSRYIGISPEKVLDGFAKKFLYGLRRNDDGELFLTRVDQLGAGDQNSIVINEQGSSDENFPDFEEGIDFLDGVDENHDIVYANLRYTQLKWDDRSLLFYIDSDTGQFIQLVSEGHQFEEEISSPGYGEGQDENVLANTDFTDAERE